MKSKKRKKEYKQLHPISFCTLILLIIKKLSDQPKVAVAFVSDNYSKFIMGYHIALENSNKNILSIIHKAIETIHLYHPNHLYPINIVSDGGSENKAISVQELLSKNKKPPLKQIIALKDIVYSNSPIEAINKIFKRYLRHFNPLIYKDFISIPESFIQDYNNLRPHGSLKGLTPFQAYLNHQTPNYKNDIELARQYRIIYNKTNRCKLDC